MPNKLKNFFPMIRTREEVLSHICSREQLSNLFDSWQRDEQEEFLDFCTGARGVKLLYDPFFKTIMNPEATPERLEEFLSLLLEKPVKILAVLPNDSTRIADEGALLVTDIVVEFEDHSIANVEIQKLGYQFPGQRSACYSSDLLLRQYKRARSRQQKAFSYKNIRTVYTIVLFEKSPKEFHAFPEDYLHLFSQKSDTGLELELLQKYIFIPLDIFGKIQHNKDITDKLDAWLVFFSSDDPDTIVRLITAWPEFRPLYEQVYDVCRNVEEVMNMFSEELRELDRNTAQLMIDEMQETIDRQKAQLEEEQKRHKQQLEKEQCLREELERKYQEALKQLAQSRP